jgi:hypothetical protein
MGLKLQVSSTQAMHRVDIGTPPFTVELQHLNVISVSFLVECGAMMIDDIETRWRREKRERGARGRRNELKGPLL